MHSVDDDVLSYHSSTHVTSSGILVRNYDHATNKSSSPPRMYVYIKKKKKRKRKRRKMWEIA